MPELDFWRFDGGGDERIQSGDHVPDAALALHDGGALVPPDAAALEAQDEAEAGADVVAGPESGVQLSGLVRLGNMVVPCLKEHIRSRWGSEKASEASSQNIFCVSFAPGTLPKVTALSAILTQLNNCVGVGEDLPFSTLPDGSMKLYFSIVRWNPQSAKRTKTNSEHQIEDMVAICPRSVVEEDTTGASPIIAAEGIYLSGCVEKQPLLLALESLSLEHMHQMLVYPGSTSKLRYNLQDTPEGFGLEMNQDGWSELPHVLKILVESHRDSGFFLEASEEASTRDLVLRQLVSADLVARYCSSPTYS